MDYTKSLENFAPQIGEIGQHSINVDPKQVETSEWYFDLIKKVLKRQSTILKRKPLRYLEIASYQHIIGYMMSREYGVESTH